MKYEADVRVEFEWEGKIKIEAEGVSEAGDKIRKLVNDNRDELLENVEVSYVDVREIRNLE